MRRGRVLLPIAILAALVALVAAGCGGSDGEAEVTVQTGSLSKTEFIKKADAICEAARAEFLAKYTKFLETHKSTAFGSDKGAQEELLSEVLESMLAPNVEAQVVKISKLGAPKDLAPQVADFLNALEDRMDKAQEDPRGFTATTTPFVTAENIARRAALNGCAESFS